jgi:hypothetical protein
MALELMLKGRATADLCAALRSVENQIATPGFRWVAQVSILRPGFLLAVVIFVRVNFFPLSWRLEGRDGREEHHNSFC